MSFTRDVKTELCQIDIQSNCCRRAYAYGFLLFGKSFNSRSVCCSTDYDFVADSFLDNIKTVTGVQPNRLVLKSGRNSIKISTQRDRKKVIESFDHSINAVSLSINHGIFESECCYGAFLRGVFLSCGTIANPNKNYHLEFVVPYKKLCQNLMSILIEYNLNVKYIQRKYSHIIYIKESESIEDLLTLMGAIKSSLTIMGIKVQKDVRNNINRQMNFEVANMNRSIEAGLTQVKAINIIERKQGLDSLSDELKELAVLRRENPDMSLKQLGECLKVPISRSGVNHRLKKLMEIAEKYE